MGKSFRLGLHTPSARTDRLDRSLALNSIQFIENSGRHRRLFMVNGHRRDDQDAGASQGMGDMNRQPQSGHVRGGHQTVEVRALRLGKLRKRELRAKTMLGL